MPMPMRCSKQNVVVRDELETHNSTAIATQRKPSRKLHNTPGLAPVRRLVCWPYDNVCVCVCVSKCVFQCILPAANGEIIWLLDHEQRTTTTTTTTGRRDAESHSSAKPAHTRRTLKHIRGATAQHNNSSGTAKKIYIYKTKPICKRVRAKNDRRRINGGHVWLVECV